MAMLGVWVASSPAGQRLGSWTQVAHYCLWSAVFPPASVAVDRLVVSGGWVQSRARWVGEFSLTGMDTASSGSVMKQ